jgi:hypothetical protein
VSLIPIIPETPLNEAKGKERSMESWLLEADRKPTRDDGPMANKTKVQVEVLTLSDKVERRNYYVATPNGGFDDYDLRPVKAWRPLPPGTAAEPYQHRRSWY